MTSRAPVRWWPLGVIAILLAIGLALIWLLPDIMTQFRVLLTYGATLIALVLFSLWAILLSRLSASARLKILAVLVLLPAGFLTLFEIQGVSGDFALNFKPRWQIKPSENEELTVRSSVRDLQPDGIQAPEGARDFPQFLGPNRDARLPDLELESDWETHPPREVWTIPVGTGWSGFAVAGGRALTQEQRSGCEVVTCYLLETGEPLWLHRDEEQYVSVIAGDGPRATPTVHEDRVYTLGSRGRLNCLDLRTGDRYWTREVLDDAGARLEHTEWGKSCSPLIDGPRVIVSGGGRDGKSLIAYDRSSGEILWSAGDDRSSYSSPLLTSLAGREQIVILNRDSVVGHQPDSGEVLWTHDWPRKFPTVAQPVPVGENRLFVASGYGVGGRMLEFPGDAESGEPTVAWENIHLRPKFTTVVLKEGHLYGLSDGILLCQEAATGKRQWKRGRYGHGQILLVGPDLLIQTEAGDLVLATARPDGHEEKARIEVLTGKCWNTLALAGEYLLVRNDRQARCFRMKLRGEETVPSPTPRD